MTDQEIEALRALEAKATPGPWRWLDGDGDGLGSIEGPECSRVCHFGHDAAYDQCCGDPPSDADEAILLAARNALPRLLEERRRLMVGMKHILRRTEPPCPCEMCCDVRATCRFALAFASAPSAELPPEQKPDHGSKP